MVNLWDKSILGAEARLCTIFYKSSKISDGVAEFAISTQGQWDYLIDLSFNLMVMKVAVKNMVCPRCISVVKQELDILQLEPVSVQLGEILFAGDLSKETIDKLRFNLASHGFEVLDDRKAMVIEKVKNTVVAIIHGSEGIAVKRNFSHLISSEIGIDYNYISSIFSSTEGITIEQFIILQRTERVKELILYNELSLSEIAYKLGYTNVQHLSTQFKKVTGLTPSYFRQMKENKRRPLDQL